MLDPALLEAALAAHHAGQADEVRRLLMSDQSGLARSSTGLQLLSLVWPDRVEARAMLQQAAFECGLHDPNAHFNLAVIEQEAGHIAAAILRYQQVLRLAPTHLGALNNLSDLLRRQGRSTDGWRLVERFLAAGGDPAGMELRFAKLADDNHRPQDARLWLAAGDAAANGRALAPDFAWEAAMIQLREEDFAAGWAGYEARRSLYDHHVLGLVQYDLPEWDGSNLGDARLLLHKEQGLGDMIMFASCIGDIAAENRQLHIAVQPPLARLFAHNFAHAQVWASASRVGEADYRHQRWLEVAGRIDCQLPLASLARLTRSQGFPKPKAYLAPVPEDAEIWAARVAVLEGDNRAALRAGLVYMARRDGVIANGVADGNAKSMSAAAVGQLAAVQGVQWFGLHDRATADALADIHGLDLIDTSPWLGDLADTAALIAQLDIVVAVDTAVAHLAGAMGKPVILMLRNKSDWRWGRHRADSYWYPDMRIVRQQVEGDWWSVAAQVADMLRQFQAG